MKYHSTVWTTFDNAFVAQGILTLCDEFVPGDPPEYFFDKNPENFNAILEVHRLVFSTSNLSLASSFKRIQRA